MQKPPVAPKPNLAHPLQRPGLSPATPRRDGLSLPSPGTPRRVKPVLAPKPCLSKLTTAGESKPLTSKSQTTVTSTPQTEGRNSHREIQQENKKPDWDYIIPICLCSHDNCMCIRNTSANKDKTEKDLKMLLKCDKTEQNTNLPGSVDNCGERTISASTKGIVAHHKPLHETFTAGRNLNTDVDNVAVRPSVPRRTWSDEANGNVIPQSAPGRGPEEDPEQASHVHQPKSDSTSPRKPVPVPVPRKPRTAVLNRQEKVEEKEEIINQEGRDRNVNEVKGSSSLSARLPVEKQPIILSAASACGMQAPPPRKKAFLSTPEKTSTSAPQTFPEEVVEEDLGWDTGSQEMEVFLDKKDEVVEREDTREEEVLYTDFSCHSPLSGSLLQSRLSRPPAITITAEDVEVKVAPKKPQRKSSPMARVQRKESPEEKEEDTLKVEEEEEKKEKVMKELPWPPGEKTNRNLLTAGSNKPSRSSLGKQRAKSFATADLVRSEGQRKNSFRKLLDMKLKVLPKLMVKGGPSPDSAVTETKQSGDGGPDGRQNLRDSLTPEWKFSCPLTGVEQSVDGHEFSAEEEQDLYYENIPYYEDIPDYINVDIGKAMRSSRASLLLSTKRQSATDDEEEAIYEVPEPYVSFEKNTRHQEYQTPAGCER